MNLKVFFKHISHLSPISEVQAQKVSALKNTIYRKEFTQKEIVKICEVDTLMRKTKLVL